MMNPKDFYRFVRLFGEWVEVAPRGLFERVEARRMAQIRDESIQHLEKRARAFEVSVK